MTVEAAKLDGHSYIAPEVPRTGAARLFAGPGQMRERCRELDWAATPLGPVESWPHSLRTIAGTVLGSAFSKIVLWGPELIQIYNDGYIPFLGTKHPWGLGIPTRVCWPEAWEFNAPIYARVFAGETVSFEDQLYPLLRNGPDAPPDDVYITLSYSPVPDDNGGVGGVLVTLIDTTQRVAARRLEAERDVLVRRLEVERARLREIFRQAPTFLSVTRGHDHVFEMANDAYYDLVGHHDIIGKTVFEVFPEVREQGFIDLLDTVLETGVPFVGREMPLSIVRTPGAPAEQRYVDFVYLPLTDADGARIGIVAHGSDVTDHVIGRQALEGANAQLAEQALELELTNQQLQDNAIELEQQSEELQATAVLLEERTEAAERSELAAEAARQAITQREQEIRTLANTIPALAWTARPGGYIDWYNARWYEYTGAMPEQMQGWGWTAVHDPVLLPNILAAWKRSIATGEMFEMMFPLRRADGEYRWFLTRVVPVRDAAGTVLRWFGINTDVTSEREAADALVRANSEVEARANDAERAVARTRALQALTAAFSAAITPDEVVTIFLELGTASVGAKTGMIMLLNPDRTAFETIWGAGYPEGFLDRFSGLPIEGNYSANGAVKEGVPQWLHSRDEAVLRFPGMADVYDQAGLAATATIPLCSGNRGTTGVVVFNFATPHAFDAAERDFIEALAGQCAQALERSQLYAAEREARAEAQEANASKSRFLANMSHELRQPLNAITGYSELMKMGVRGPVTQQQVDDLERIRSSSAHLTTLIGDILEFARIEAGQLTYKPTDVPLGATLAEVTTFIAPQIEAKRLVYDFQSCHADLTVHADRDRFIQAVLNLLTNATKYTEEGGSITLSCSVVGPAQDVIAIRVADTGIGIPKERLLHIFDPFVQAHRSLNRPTEGVGLGLAIARDMARNMGGDLTVESQERVGSTFVLTLPRGARESSTD